MTVDRQAYMSDLPSPSPDQYQNDKNAIHVSVAPSAPGVGLGVPPAANTSAKMTSHSYIHVDISSLQSVPQVTSLTLKLQPTTDGAPNNASPDTAKLQACVLNKELPAQFDSSKPPPYDCSNSVTGTRAADGSWSFDITRLLQTWTSSKNTGAAIVAKDLGTTDNWAVSFDRTKSAATAVLPPPQTQAAGEPAPTVAGQAAPITYPNQGFVATVPLPVDNVPGATQPQVTTSSPTPTRQQQAPTQTTSPTPASRPFPWPIVGALAAAAAIAFALAMVFSRSLRANVGFSARSINLRSFSPVGTAVPVLALALVAAPTFTALGATNPLRPGGITALSPSGGPSTNGPAAPGDQTPSPGAIGGAANGTGGLTAGGRPAGSTSSTGAVRGGGGGPFVHGVSATQILLGRFRYVNSDSYNAAFGANVPSGNPDAEEKAVVDYVNAHGGILGRQVVVNHYTIDPNAGQSTQQIENGACAQWTQDVPVYAVLAGGTDNFKQCLGKAGVPVINDSVFSGADDGTFGQFPNYFELNALDLTSQAKAQPNGLHNQGLFGGANVLSSCPTTGSKIGLLTWDDPRVHRAVDSVLKPELARLGEKIDASGEHYFPLPQSTDTTASDIASMSNVVFQFQSNCIDRVIIFDDAGASIIVFFSRSAQSQGYNPRYGMSSGSGCGAVVERGSASGQATGGGSGAGSSDALVNPAQMKGAVCVGWNPLGDVEAQHDSGAGPGYPRCVAAMKSEGADQYFNGQTNATVIAVRICDGFFFTQQAANASGSPDSRRFTAGVESLGFAFQSGLVYSDNFVPGRHTGPSGVRESTFDAGCQCFVYKSGVKNY